MNESTHYELQFEAWPDSNEYRTFNYFGEPEEFDSPNDVVMFWTIYKRYHPEFLGVRARIVEVRRTVKVERTIEP